MTLCFHCFNMQLYSCRFSGEGTPFYMDSNGILRMLNNQAGKTWTQIADTKTHVSI